MILLWINFGSMILLCLCMLVQLGIREKARPGWLNVVYLWGLAFAGANGAQMLSDWATAPSWQECGTNASLAVMSVLRAWDDYVRDCHVRLAMRSLSLIERDRDIA